MNNRKTSRRKFLTKSGLGALGLPFLGAGCSRKDERDRNQDTFSFAFVTDIHLKPEMHAPEGFQMAIDRVNELQPDFVITGGDLVYDAMRGDFDRCDMLFQLYKKMSSGFTMPVFNCLGNHDLFAIYGESQEPASHPDYKYGMWERYFGDTYYSFDHKGWHFITLNSLDVTEDQRYRGIFSDEQLDWLLSDLAEVSTETPIVVTTHIPMICTRTQLIGSANTPNVANALPIW
ncbi:MAG: metallophosphoesterase [Saprospiraceae bacterium]|nr:metallophosphoesterase [Saprospiraceae bacterium]